MEKKPESIHELLGVLRRRVTELSKGDYTRGYRNEMTYVKMYIESFSPEELVTNLKPIYDDLNSINDKIYSLVSDELYDLDSDEVPERNLTGESPRDIMKREVRTYLIDLEYYLKKYSKFLSIAPKRKLR